MNDKDFSSDLKNKLLFAEGGKPQLTHDETVYLMHQLAKEFPKNVSIESIGKSYEDRDIFVLKV